MKKTLALFLLLCFTAPFLGSYSWLLLSREWVRKEIKHQILAGMDREDLVLLVFTRQETLTKLRWEHDREFEFAGHMYDVVDSGIRGDSLFFLCYPDHRETALNQHISKLVRQAASSSPLQRAHQQQLNHFLHLSYIPSPFVWHSHPQGTDRPFAAIQPSGCSPGFSDPPFHPPQG